MSGEWHRESFKNLEHEDLSHQYNLKSHTSGQPTDGLPACALKGAFSVRIRVIFIKNVGQGDGGGKIS